MKLLADLFARITGQTPSEPAKPIRPRNFDEVTEMARPYVAFDRLQVTYTFNSKGELFHTPKVDLDLIDVRAMRDADTWTLKIDTQNDMTMTYGAETRFGGGTLQTWSIDGHARAFQRLGFKLIKDGEGLGSEHWLEKGGLTTDEMFSLFNEVDLALRQKIKAVNIQATTLNSNETLGFGEGLQLYSWSQHKISAQLPETTAPAAA